MIFTDALKGFAESFRLLPPQARFHHRDCAISIGYEVFLHFHILSFPDASKNTMTVLAILSKLSHPLSSQQASRIRDVILRVIPHTLRPHLLYARVCTSNPF